MHPDRDSAVRTYLKAIEAALRQGSATEHTHRPALKTLIEALAGRGVQAINEPRHIECGAPDLIVARGTVPLGYVEAKDVGADLDRAEKSAQLGRYRESLSNLVLTDYLEFRWFLDGEPRLKAALPHPGRDGLIRFDTDAASQTAQLLDQFLAADIPLKSTPRELATRMAGLARLIRGLIEQTFASEEKAGELHAQRDAFRKVLIESLTTAQFADMYAQTLCYGLFAARCNAPARGFTRQIAAGALPKTNPFLRKLFNSIAGPDLDPRIAWAVDQLAELLARADMAAILEDFGKRTRREDPVVHFYETFLAAYDSKMREARGVYYTPEPVVGYIVRSVEALLKREFGMKDGLAHAKKIKLTRPTGKGREPIETHRLQILDPATGTGTFLYAVIAKIRERFAGNKGAWPGYVAEHLLPRLFGFELLMAPYAVAHMKLGLELELSGYDFASDERLGVYLTNSLEEAHELAGLPLFTQWLAEESRAASKIKREAPVMVVLGNPPYSGHSANTGAWIVGLLRGFDALTGRSAENYFLCDGKPLGERNPKWLNDDYVKFIRFAQWRIAQTGHGILGFVTNHGYLDNPTFRGMRESLMHGFDEIYLLDLHGNSKKKEKAPDGGKDENVFDIQQGVAISLFVKHANPGASSSVVPAQAGTQSEKDPGRRPGFDISLDSGLRRNDEDAIGRDGALARVFHADLYGTREIKYATLDATDIAHTEWRELAPASPNYYFVPEDSDLREEYERGWKITDAMPVNVLGFQTHRDGFAIDLSHDALRQRIEAMRKEDLSDSEFAERHALKDNASWSLSEARKALRADENWKSKIIRVAYRPFDNRWAYFSEVAMDRPRREIIENVAGKPNLCLNLTRNTREEEWRNAVVSDKPAPAVYVEIKEGSTIFPLWLYPREKTDLLDEAPAEKTANLAPEFVAALTAAVGETPSPEDTLAYMYAILYTPSYRERYADFLKRDFPRVPLTTDREFFGTMVKMGRALIALHTMETTLPRITGYPVAGSNEVVKVRFAPPSPQPSPASGRGSKNTSPASEGGGNAGRVYINAEQYFDGVPEAVWAMHIGGYRIAEKWLKDRKGRKLGYDDLTHYQNVIAALARTLELQSELDAALEAAGGWPLE